MSAYGWKATIGFIGPPRTNETVLQEAFRLAPPGVSWCWSTMGLPEFGQFEFDEALALATKCAKELADRDVSVIVMTGIPLMTSKGVAFHRQIEQEISTAISGRKPVTSDVGCVIAALKALKLENIVMSSIYQRFIQDNVIRCLDAHGIHTLADEGLSFALADCMTRPTMDTAYEVTLQAHAKAPQSDGVLICCPQWPVIGNIERMERELAKPVVTHLGAIYWGALSFIGKREPVTGYGELLAKFPAWVDARLNT